MDATNPEGALMDALKDSELPNVTVDFADGLLQTLDGSNIPILGPLIGVLKTARGISDYLFAKKIAEFLFTLKDVPLDQRRKQVDKLNADEGFGQQAGATILLLLDRMSDMQKPTMMGRAYKAFLEERIDLYTLRSLNHALDMFDLGKKQDLVAFYSGDSHCEEAEQHFAVCNLAAIEIDNSQEIAEARGTKFFPTKSFPKLPPLPVMDYERNELGRMFCRVLLEFEVPA